MVVNTFPEVYIYKPQKIHGKWVKLTLGQVYKIPAGYVGNLAGMTVFAGQRLKRISKREIRVT